MIRVAVLLSAAVSIGTAAGCGAGSTEPTDAPYPPERVRFSCNSPGPVALPAAYPFAFTFEMPASAPRGEPITFTLTVRNVGTAAAHLWTVLPEQSLNVVVRRDDDRTVWDRLISEFDGTVALVARSRPIQPGGTESFQVRWDQVGLNGRPVPAGRYRVFATLGNSEYTGSEFSGYADARSEPCSYRSDVRTLSVEGS